VAAFAIFTFGIISCLAFVAGMVLGCALRNNYWKYMLRDVSGKLEWKEHWLIGVYAFKVRERNRAGNRPRIPDRRNERAEPPNVDLANEVLNEPSAGGGTGFSSVLSSGPPTPPITIATSIPTATVKPAPAAAGASASPAG
jgi:hypothetical protein